MKSVHVLLVEDNPADVRLTREMLAMCRLKVEISVAMNGEEAVEFLKRRGAHAKAAVPDLILLDLNLPKMDGREVLDSIKKDGELKRIPVIVLTSSESEKDIVKSYDLGANCYVTKPLDFGTFRTIVEALEGFWFTIVRLPTQV